MKRAPIQTKKKMFCRYLMIYMLIDYNISVAFSPREQQQQQIQTESIQFVGGFERNEFFPIHPYQLMWMMWCALMPHINIDLLVCLIECRPD